MALSGTIPGSVSQNTGKYEFFITWSASQNPITNQSTITANLKLKVKKYRMSTSTASYSLTIGGQGVSKSGQSMDYGNNSSDVTYTIATTTRTVSHNSSGALSIEISASAAIASGGYGPGNCSAKQTVTLNQIDRSAPVISIGTISNISASGMYFSASSNTTCDIWEYSTNNGSSWVQYSTSAATSAATTLSNLSPNTTYQLKVRARKKVNQVYGASEAKSVKTLGGSLLNSVDILTADASSPVLTFNWTVYDSSYKHTLNIKNGSTTILSITNLTGSGTASKSIILTDSQKSVLLSYMASMSSFQVTYVLSTFSGSTQIGNASSKTNTIQTMPVNSAPYFSNPDGFTYQDTNPDTVQITDNNQILIKGQSSLSVTPYTATAKNAAVISKYEATVQGKTVSKASGTLNVGTVNNSGTALITVKAIDSRGYEASSAKSVTVIDYTPVRIEQSSIRRNNEVDADTEFSFSGRLSPITIENVDKNYITSSRWRCKKTTDADSEWSTYQNLDITSDSSSFSFSNDAFGDFESDYSWDIQVEIADRLDKHTIDLLLPLGTPLLSYRPKKLGINNRNPQSALDVIGDANITGNLSLSGVLYSGGVQAQPEITVSGILKGVGNGTISSAVAGTDYVTPNGYITNPIYIPNNSNLNDYKTSGWYYNGANANVTNIANIPEPVAFNLEVSNAGDSIIQTWCAYNSSVVYRRSYYNWENNWSTWKMYSSVAMIQTGSTADGNYVKFSDGTMVCYGNRIQKTTNSNGIARFDFPAKFINIPAVIPSFIAINTVFQACNINWANSEYLEMYIINTSAGTKLTNTDVNLYYIAFGRWKW